MGTIGIIAEYNPFHNGHALQIREARRSGNADHIVVIMSPDFVQRGEAAITDKYTRTKMALAGGADIVLELPVRCAAAGARDFARGAVGILNSLNCIDELVFGCENDDPDVLQILSSILAREPDEYRRLLRQNLKSGAGYAAARETALLSFAQSLREKEKVLLTNALNSHYLRNPNNILAVEYCISLRLLGSSILPRPLLRTAASHHDRADTLPKSSAIQYVPETDNAATDAITSAQAIRDLLRLSPPGRSVLRTEPYIPEAGFRILSETISLRGIPSDDIYSRLLQYCLLTQTSFSAYADISSDLSRRIIHLLPFYENAKQFTDLLQARQYPLTHCARALLHIFLGLIKPEMPEASVSEPDPLFSWQPSQPDRGGEYVRILGFRRNAAPLLHILQKKAAIPVITKTAAAAKILTAKQAAGFETDLRASHLYSLLFESQTEKPLRSEYTVSPIIFP